MELQVPQSKGTFVPFSILSTDDILSFMVDSSSEKVYSAWDDRRIEPRVPSKGEGRLTLLQTPNPKVLTVEIIDVSRYGLQVELDIPVTIATNVEITLNETIVMGLVGNCRRRQSGRYRIGIVTGTVIEPSRRAIA